MCKRGDSKSLMITILWNRILACFENVNLSALFYFWKFQVVLWVNPFTLMYELFQYNFRFVRIISLWGVNHFTFHNMNHYTLKCEIFHSNFLFCVNWFNQLIDSFHSCFTKNMVKISVNRFTPYFSHFWKLLHFFPKTI